MEGATATATVMAAMVGTTATAMEGATATTATAMEQWKARWQWKV